MLTGLSALSGLSAVGGGSIPPPVNTVLPTTNENNPPVVGDTITATPGTWTNSPTSYTYQWTRDNDAIGGATSITYVLTTGEIGMVMRVIVTAINAGGSTEATSIASNPVVNLAPVNTVAPALDNTTPTVGQAVNCSTGTWNNAPTGYAYQWQRNGDNIGGDTTNQHVAVQADAGQALTCEVTASNSNPASTMAESNATDLVLAPPVNTVAPVCTTDGINAPGGPAIGGVDTCSTTDGTWTGYPAPTFSYANTFTNGGTNNFVATSALETSTTRKFIVTATNSVSAVPADSNGMDIVT